VTFAPAWSTRPRYAAAVADRVRAALEAIPAALRGRTPLVFTAHSVPVAMADASPYVADLTAAAQAVAARLGHSRWSIAYQSRSGSPREPWLEPDVGDLLDRFAAAGERHAVVVPIGFVGEQLPTGMQILGQPWSEGQLIQFAYAYEQATQHRRPPPSVPPLSRTWLVSGANPGSEPVSIWTLTILFASRRVGTSCTAVADTRSEVPGGVVPTVARVAYEGHRRHEQIASIALDSSADVVHHEHWQQSWLSSVSRGWEPVMTR